MQRHDVASTLNRRCINVMCPLGYSYLREYQFCEACNNVFGFGTLRVWIKHTSIAKIVLYSNRSFCNRNKVSLTWYWKTTIEYICCQNGIELHTRAPLVYITLKWLRQRLIILDINASRNMRKHVFVLYANRKYKSASYRYCPFLTLNSIYWVCKRTGKAWCSGLQYPHMPRKPIVQWRGSNISLRWEHSTFKIA